MGTFSLGIGIGVGTLIMQYEYQPMKCVQCMYMYKHILTHFDDKVWI